MAGLQLISPMVTALWVSSKVAAPSRAAALAASHPAWPPPMTMTSQARAGAGLRSRVMDKGPVRQWRRVNPGAPAVRLT